MKGWRSTCQALESEFYSFPSWAQSNNQPGTSNGVVTNGSTVGTSQSITIFGQTLSEKKFRSLSDSERAARKRKRDQAYRARCKNRNVELQFHLEMLTGENESLEKENVSLKEDSALMEQTVRDQAKEIGCLMIDAFQSKCENTKLNVLVQTLSELLADPVRLENMKLKDENAALRKNADLNSNLTQLVEETAKLSSENEVLKVQNDALCGKIISGSEKKHEQEH